VSRRTEFSPALVASFALHAGVLVGLMLLARLPRDLQLGASVPVNIVANGPTTDLAPAVQAPEEAPAQTETPVPDAPPEPAAPTPAPQPKPVPPKPAPPKPTPTPQPAPKPAPAKPAPAKPAAKPQKTLDLDALAASLGGRTSSANRGPSRPQTAQQARPDLGSGATAAAVSGMGEEIQRRWNPNCNVEGGRDVRLRVNFQLGMAGQVVGTPTVQVLSAPGPVAEAAKDRAVRALFAASPFRSVPRELYGQSFNINFAAQKACD
jgi:outer membrane biosynthesis protein TonB